MNLARWDRLLRFFVAAAASAAAVVAPLPLWGVIGVLAMAAALAATALTGTCLGYRLLGVSTCPTKAPR